MSKPSAALKFSRRSQKKNTSNFALQICKAAQWRVKINIKHLSNVGDKSMFIDLKIFWNFVLYYFLNVLESVENRWISRSIKTIDFLSIRIFSCRMARSRIMHAELTSIRIFKDQHFYVGYFALFTLRILRLIDAKCLYDDTLLKKSVDLPALKLIWKSYRRFNSEPDETHLFPEI